MVRRSWLNLLQGKKQRRRVTGSKAAPVSSAVIESLETRELLAAFTPGNLVVYRVGDGSGALSGNAAAVFLDEYTTAGVLVQSVALPTTVSGANAAFTQSGTATSAGNLTLSSNGQYLASSGYNAAVGTTGVTGTTSAATARVVGLVDIFGISNTTTQLSDAYSGNNIRGVVTDGTSIWTAGTGTNPGVRYVANIGDTTSTQLSTTVTNIRTVDIFGGQLYASMASGAFRLATVGTGIPTTSGQTITNLPGFPTAAPGSTSPYSFFFADLSGAVAGVDTVYVADDSLNVVQKWSLVGGSWTASGTAALTGVRGLTAAVNGSSVSLYASNGSTLQALTDTSGYNANLTATFTSFATAGTNTVFRGVAWAPTAAFGTAGDDTFNITAATGGINVTRNGSGPVFVSNAQLSTFTINGLGGNDTFNIAAGVNVGSILGGNGNDTFVIGAGATIGTLDGGADIDTLDYSAFATGVTVRLSSNLDYGTISATGITTLVATAGDANVENVTGGTGNDVLAGTDGANILIGGGGNDLLYARGGNDTLNGGAGNDNYYFRSYGAGLQTKVLTELSGSDYLHFGAVTNNLTVDLTASGLQTVATGELALNFTGTDFENVWGGSGSDIITGNALANVIFGNGSGDTLSGGDGNDTIYGGAGIDFIFGGNDNDTLVGDDGNDTISGEAGNDTIDGRAGNDTLSGGIGNDVLRGGVGDDSLDGGANNDSIIGEAGDDSLTGGDGDDTYSFFAPVGTESDSITGESSGTDTIFFAASVTQNVTLQLNIAAGAQNVITGTNSLTLSLNGVQFERVTGGSGNDIIIGNASANILTGGAGNDVLVGLAGNDTLSGGEGDDVLIGGLGGDVLNGLGGSDLLVAGESSVQTNVASLLAIQTAWSDGSAYASRQAAVTPLLGTLTDNNVFDRLTGGTEQDLFFAQLADLVTDLVGGENRVTI